MDGARVLVIDDDVLVGRAIRRVLKGHEVHVETDPRRGLERLLARERFDLVLCDFHMPELSGAGVFRVVAQAAPDLLDRFVFVTGGTATPRDRELIETAPGGFMTKPFDGEEMRALAASAAAGLRPLARALRS
jgi:DNA-binding NarL/FixJ family response regulator